MGLVPLTCGMFPDQGSNPQVSCITGRLFTTEPPKKPYTHIFMMLLRILYFSWLLGSLVRYDYSPCSEVTEEVPWLGSSAVQTLELGGTSGYAPWLDGVTGWTPCLDKASDCVHQMRRPHAGWAGRRGSVAGQYWRLGFEVAHVPGSKRLETMLNSRAWLLAWLPAQAALRMCSTTPGHL